MRDVGGHFPRAAGQQGVGRVAKRAAGIHDVVDQDAVAPGHVADDVHDFRFAGAFAALVDDRERRIDPLCQGAGADHTADVGRDDHHVADVEPFLDVTHHDRRREQVVGRDIEEALNLAGMQIHGQHAVGTGMGDHVGDELRRDRRARAGLTVLAGVAEIRHHGGDSPCRRATAGVRHDENFHQMVIRRKRRRLDDEHVLPADVFLNLDEDFHVGEAPNLTFREGDTKIGGNRFSKGAIGIARQNFHHAYHLHAVVRRRLLAAMVGGNNSGSA